MAPKDTDCGHAYAAHWRERALELEKRIYVEDIGDGRITVSGHTFINESTHRAICAGLERNLADCSREFHAAINEAEYAGTRADWIHRAQAAEAMLEVRERQRDAAESSVSRYEDKVVELEREVARLKNQWHSPPPCLCKGEGDEHKSHCPHFGKVKKDVVI